MFKIFITALLLFLINSCSNTQKSIEVKNSTESLNSNSAKALYFDIYKNIKNRNLDSADDAYIKIKSDFENSEYLKKASLLLATVHMQNQEYILANFYLQETLQIDSSDEFARFLLIKNQYLAAVKNRRDLNYINRALKALETNINLVSDSDYTILANTILTRVKLESIWKNREIGNLYKRLNKIKASEIYLNKIKALGLENQELVK